MDKFIDLVKTSVITQGIITIGILVVDSVLILKGQTVPQQLWDITFAVIAFYFGSKVGVEQGKASIIANQ